MKLKDIKIGTKLLTSYFIIAALTGVVGFLGITEIYEIDDANTMLYEKMTVPIGHVADMAAYFQRMRVNVRDHIFATNDLDKKKFYDRIFELKSEFEKASKEYESTLFTDEGRRLWQASFDAMNKYISFMPQIERQVMDGNIEGALAVMKGDMWKANEEVQKALDHMYKNKIALAKQTADNNTATANAASRFMVVLILVAVAFSIIIGLIMSRGITVPLAKGVKFAEEIAAGDLTARLDVEQKDEIGQLGTALQQMRDKLQEIIMAVFQGADNIVAASMQMSTTSQQISQGATEQASSSEEVTSSVEEMASSIQQNTDNSLEAKKIAVKGAKGIEDGSQATNTAVNSMEQIVEKISFVNEIARQTNILALNAAVEAARAGEHGRGFAVVADEVRKLAERSRIAADEIDKISKNGMKVAENAGKILVELVPEIKRTAQLVQEISAASNEQNSGAAQINNAIQQLNTVTQQNAAASEELATASEELSAQALQLKEMIAYFKLDNQQRRAVKQQNYSQLAQERKTQVAHINQPTRKVAGNGNGKAPQFANSVKDSLDSGFELHM